MRLSSSSSSRMIEDKKRLDILSVALSLGSHCWPLQGEKKIHHYLDFNTSISLNLISTIHFQFCNEVILITEKIKHLTFFPSAVPGTLVFSYSKRLSLSKEKESNVFHHMSLGDLPRGIALELIYHIIPLVSRN